MDQPYFQTGLNIDTSYYNTLDIRSFMLMLKDPSYCYKFYWLEAIVTLISEGITETTFNDIIDEMICKAWYSVREFHIHLSGLGQNGEVRDGLERAILKLSELSDLPANASRVEIKNAIRQHNSELRPAKEQLTNMVPYYDIVLWGKNTRQDLKDKQGYFAVTSPFDVFSNCFLLSDIVT